MSPFLFDQYLRKML